MALVLGRKIGEVVYAETKNGNTIEITLLSHRHNGSDKLALVKASYENLDEDEHELVEGGTEAVLCSNPYIAVGLQSAGRRGVRLAFHGHKDEVTFLRKEVKERTNG